ncbi:YbjQ family protein [Sphingomonas sp. RHCKR7]|uniref:heavy metal-binding domain-containing protein n=1 Tax=Sphingomonas folli TaxID=2862497 RepID=UPI001C67DDF5|nr:heavy metal-binding domain-containing protein [Sphingomonas folli]MBW6525259.1 YbjQ family protein [Sphingomonas folli]
MTNALASGANCILAVDIDYGTTGNNAATVNMQGTAVVIANLSAVLAEDTFD